MMEESDSCSSESRKINSISNTSSSLHFLGLDLTELILSSLPIPSIIRASSVCKLWNSILHSHSFKTRLSDSRRSPWLFVCCRSKSSPNNIQVFAFDPESNSWLKLPSKIVRAKHSFAASNGFYFTNSSTEFSFKPVFNGAWRQTRPSRFSRCSPLIGAYNEPECSKSAKFIVVGGSRESCLAVEIYDSHHDSWELCPPLPDIFNPGNCSQLLCLSLFKGKFYIFSIYSGFISSMELETRLWSDVQTLRPPGVLFSYLISCQDRLVLAGLCSVNNKLEFNLWQIEDQNLEFTEIGIMPRHMLSSFLDNSGDQRFGSLKCAGSGDLVYVYNEKYSSNCAVVCICEISSSGKCSWRRIPNLPEHVNNSNKVTISTFVPTVF